MSPEMELERLEQELIRLNNLETRSDSYDIKNNDVYGGYESTRKIGSEKEIAEVERKISLLGPIVESRKGMIDEHSKAFTNKKEPRDLEYEKTLTLFRTAKSNYGQKKFITRAVNKATGKTPNWARLLNQLVSGSDKVAADLEQMAGMQI